MLAIDDSARRAERNVRERRLGQGNARIADGGVLALDHRFDLAAVSFAEATRPKHRPLGLDVPCD